MTTDGLITNWAPARPRRPGPPATPVAPEPGPDPIVDWLVERLQDRLAAVVRDHGLNRRRLVEVHRGIRRLERSSTAPTGDEFWDATAVPRARRLVDRARDVIDHELDVLVADLGFSGPWPGVGAEAQPTQPELSEHLLPILPRTADLDGLGWWWQRRLRRRAVIRAMPRILTATVSEVGRVVARTEMELLDQPPWTHGDRLLSAYELAYADIERFGTTRVRRAQDNLLAARRGRLALRL